MRRGYYPLTGTKGQYKEPTTYYLQITHLDDQFLASAIMTNDYQITEIEDAKTLAGYITTLESKSWLICYDLDFIGLVFYDFISVFDTLSGYGQETRVMTLTHGDNEWYLVDAFQFFGDGLPTVLTKTGYEAGNRMQLDDLPTEEEIIRYTRSRVLGILTLWQNLRLSLNNVFGVHPSRTPGATALKCWRVTLDELKIKPRGKPITMFTTFACNMSSLYWSPGYYETAYQYDLNAAYPHVMRTMNYPLDLVTFYNRPPVSNRWIATVKINYKTGRKFSPLTVRIDDKSLVHPTTAESVRVTLTYLDAITLGLSGEFEIIEWIEGVYWFPEWEQPLFREWGDRVQNRIIANPEEKLLIKVASRALHSKFAQRPGAPMVEIKRVPPDAVIKLGNKVSDLYPLPDGDLAIKILTRKRPKYQPYIRPDWEALTLAGARLMVHSAIDNNTIYVDTDCIISTVPRDDLPIGTLFGEWKLEKTGQCYITGPRMYVISGKPKLSGVRTNSRDELELALIKATHGKLAVVDAIERSSLNNPTVLQGYREHSVLKISYPLAECKGNIAFVTRSPTKKHKIITNPRVLR